MAKPALVASGRAPMGDDALTESRFMRSLRVRPLDAVGLVVAGAASVMILVNALFLQGGPRPAPATGTTGAPAVPYAAPAQTNEVADAAPLPLSPIPLVKEVQAELARRGIYEGVADGLTGPRTEAAIMSFETIAGMKPTGQATPQLLALLRQTVAPTAAPNNDVLQVQRALERLRMGPIKTDGVMGEGTRAAIRRFEASRGLPPRGEITPALRRQLSEAGKTAAR